MFLRGDIRTGFAEDEEKKGVECAGVLAMEKDAPPKRGARRGIGHPEHLEGVNFNG